MAAGRWIQVIGLLIALVAGFAACGPPPALGTSALRHRPPRAAGPRTYDPLLGDASATRKYLHNAAILAGPVAVSSLAARRSSPDAAPAPAVE